MSIVLILINAVVAQVGQLFLKRGMSNLGEVSLRTLFKPRNIRALILSPLIWAGMVLFLAAIAVWIAVLAFEDLSVAVPLQAVGYIVLILLAHLILKERLTIRRVAGTVIISIGIFVVLLERLVGSSEAVPL